LIWWLIINSCLTHYNTKRMAYIQSNTHASMIWITMWFTTRIPQKVIAIVEGEKPEDKRVLAIRYTSCLRELFWVPLCFYRNKWHQYRNLFIDSPYDCILYYQNTWTEIIMSLFAMWFEFPGTTWWTKWWQMKLNI